MPEKTTQASVTGWTNFFRKLWTVAPNKLITAKVIVAMTAHQLGSMRELRQKIRDEDLYWPEKAMKQWDDEYAALEAQMKTWIDAIAKDQTDAVATLIVPQLLYSPRPKAGEKFQAPFVARSVSLLNQLIAQFKFVATYVLTGTGPALWVADTLNEGIQELTGHAAPGEEKTVRDQLGGVIDSAKDNMAQFWEAAKKAARYGAIALLALAALYVATRPTRRAFPQPTE